MDAYRTCVLRTSLFSFSTLHVSLTVTHLAPLACPSPAHRARQTIAELGSRFIRANSTVLTHGYSRVVLKVLQQAFSSVSTGNNTTTLVSLRLGPALCVTLWLPARGQGSDGCCGGNRTSSLAPLLWGFGGSWEAWLPYSGWGWKGTGLGARYDCA